MSIVELERAPSRFDFDVDIPFVKSAELDEKGKPTGVLELRGYASTWVKDRDEEWIDPAAFDKSLEYYLAKNPIILWQHQADQAIGTMKGASVDQFGLDVVAHVPLPGDKAPAWKHHAYESIQRGIVRTFSIGGVFKKDFIMGRQVIQEIDLMEVSVVSIPSNPESIFEAVSKALSGDSRRPRVHPGHVKQMRQLVGIDEITDPELHMMSAAEKVARYEMIAAAYRKSGVMPPAIDEWIKLKPIVDAISAEDGKDALVGATDQIISFMRKANAGMAIDGKRGRTISAKNEDALRAALNVIDTAEKKIDDWAVEAKKIVADAKEQIAVVLKQVDDPEEEEEEDAASEEPSQEERSGEPVDDGIGDAVARAAAD